MITQHNDKEVCYISYVVNAVRLHLYEMKTLSKGVCGKLDSSAGDRPSKKTGWLAGLLATSLMVTGCAKAGGIDRLTQQGEAAQKTSNEPVTLKVAFFDSEERFKQLTQNEVFKRKFPHVTLEYMKYSELQNALTAGQTPDLIATIIAQLGTLEELGLRQDLAPLIAQTKLDMSKFEQKKIEVIQSYGNKGEIYALPDSLHETSPYNTYALVYNKDVFDRFGEPYPKNDMTWDQTMDLARKFYRTDNGVDYKGLVVHNAPYFLAFQMGLEYVGADGKVQIADPKWSELFRINKRFSQEQGGFLPQGGIFGEFAKKNVAMYAGDASTLFTAPDKYNDFQWDVATFPIFGGMPAHTVVAPNGGMWTISSTSKNKELAIRVLDTILSVEAQKSVPGYNWWEHPQMKTKNLGVLKNPNYPTVRNNRFMLKYNAQFRTEVSNAIGNMSAGNEDINTAIRKFQEKFQQVIDMDVKK